MLDYTKRHCFIGFITYRGITLREKFARQLCWSFSMTKNWLLTIRTKMRDGTEKVSRSPMISESDISHSEAMEVAISQFGAERVISITEK